MTNEQVLSLAGRVLVLAVVILLETVIIWIPLLRRDRNCTEVLSKAAIMSTVALMIFYESLLKEDSLSHPLFGGMLVISALLLWRNNRPYKSIPSWMWRPFKVGAVAMLLSIGLVVLSQAFV